MAVQGQGWKPSRSLLQVMEASCKAKSSRSAFMNEISSCVDSSICSASVANKSLFLTSSMLSPSRLANARHSAQMFEWVGAGYFGGENKVQVRMWTPDMDDSGHARAGDDGGGDDTDDLMDDLMDDGDEEEKAKKGKDQEDVGKAWTDTDKVNFAMYL